MAATIDIAIEAGQWPPPDELHALLAPAVAATFAELGLGSAEGRELSLLFTDDAHMRALNRQWRERDRPTNVLSFPAFELAPDDPLPPLLGDIVLARETVSREAGLDGKPFDHHLIHLVVHGLLHLLGYDHEDARDAALMEDRERRILAGLGIADPYD